jgi:hypothetical protein
MADQICQTLETYVQPHGAVLSADHFLVSDAFEKGQECSEPQASHWPRFNPKG